ncbi:MAG: PAS domain S-box protein, partial [Planctomycetota bacterium]
GEPAIHSEPTLPGEDVWADEVSFQGLVEATQDLVTAVNQDGCFLYVNPVAERILGLEPGQCLGRRALDFVHAADRERTRASFERWIAADPDEPLSFENRQVHVDGSVRDMLWTVTRLPAARHGMVLVSVARDVTALRTAERDLLDREIRLRSIMTGMLDAVVTIDAYGIIRFASNSVEAVFGYAPEELVGQSVNLLMPEPYRSEHDGYLDRYRRTGETWILNTTREFEAVRKSGTRLWIEVSVARIDIPGEDDAPLFCGTIRDVTVRKQAERALRKSEERFRAIFDQEFQLVGLLGPTGIILEMNVAAMSSVGARRADVIGHPFWETKWWAHDPALATRCEEWVRRAGRGEFVREEVLFPSKAGGMRAIDFSLKPIYDDSGKVILILPEGRDITDLKRALDRERQMQGALAALGESASILAHEIKNPITSINLALRAVAKELGEDDKAVLEDLVVRMQRLEKMMRRTLSFTKPLDLVLSRVDVVPLLLAPVDTLRAEADELGIDLQIDVTSNCPAILVDEGLANELLTNLIRNAMEAVERDGLVRCSARALDGREVEIVVEDDGPGVPEHMLTTLFRPFTTTKEKGSGLGLALAKKIVEQHGGSIVVDRSSLGGARFSLRLPIAPPAPTPPTRAVCPQVHPRRALRTCAEPHGSGGRPVRVRAARPRIQSRTFPELVRTLRSTSRGVVPNATSNHVPQSSRHGNQTHQRLPPGRSGDLARRISQPAGGHARDPCGR